MNIVTHKLIHNSNQFKMRQVLWSLFGLFLIAYFVFHTVEGKRGIFVLEEFQAQTVQNETILKDLQNRRTALEKTVAGLNADNLDKDLLDEKAREVLGLMGRDEVILVSQVSMK